MAAVRVVVTDANILINLIHVQHLSLLGDLADFSFVVPDEVVAEVSDPQRTLREALEAGMLVQQSICEIQKIYNYHCCPKHGQK